VEETDVDLPPHQPTPHPLQVFVVVVAVLVVLEALAAPTAQPAVVVLSLFDTQQTHLMHSPHQLAHPHIAT
jgi:hypothetical protein